MIDFHAVLSAAIDAMDTEDMTVPEGMVCLHMKPIEDLIGRELREGEFLGIVTAYAGADQSDCLRVFALAHVIGRIMEDTTRMTAQ